MRPLILAALAAAALPACGGDVTMEEFLTQYPAAYCTYHLHCCIPDEQS